MRGVEFLMRKRFRIVLPAALFAAVLFLFLASSRAATVTVTDEASLRSALSSAQNGDEIRIPAGTTIDLTQPITVQKNVTLSGTGTIRLSSGWNASGVAAPLRDG